MKNVVIAGPVHKSGIDLLQTRSDILVKLISHPPESELAKLLVDADALIVRMTPVQREAIMQARKLKVVARHGVGYENIDVASLSERGIPLAVVGNVNATAVAEHTVFLMLTLAKRGVCLDKAVRSGNWQARDTFGAAELRHRPLLIMGFGRIGAEVARLAYAFGMQIAVYDPLVSAGIIEGHGYRRVEDWQDVLGKVDFVTLHVPLTPYTRSMFGKEELAAMRPGAYLVNAARGGLVDECALHWALSSGHLAGAALDSFDSEPPDPNNPMLELENIVLSPHSAALTKECAERMAVAAAQNVLDGLDGRLDPLLVVNKKVLADSNIPN